MPFLIILISLFCLEKAWPLCLSICIRQGLKEKRWSQCPRCWASLGRSWKIWATFTDPTDQRDTFVRPDMASCHGEVLRGGERCCSQEGTGEQTAAKEGGGWRASWMCSLDLVILLVLLLVPSSHYDVVRSRFEIRLRCHCVTAVFWVPRNLKQINKELKELAENLEIVTAERQIQSDKLKQLKEDRFLPCWNSGQIIINRVYGEWYSHFWRMICHLGLGEVATFFILL